MKKLWWSTAVLAFLLAATLLNSHYVSGITDSLAVQLTRAEELAESGQWEQAEAVTRSAQEHWDNSAGYFYTVLRHSDTDAVNVGFCEVLEFIRCEESGEYSASNASLIARIRLLADMEQLNLRNLL